MLDGISSFEGNTVVGLRASDGRDSPALQPSFLQNIYSRRRDLACFFALSNVSHVDFTLVLSDGIDKSPGRVSPSQRLRGRLGSKISLPGPDSSLYFAQYIHGRVIASRKHR